MVRKMEEIGSLHKGYEMTSYQKQLMVLAFHFFTEEIEDKDHLDVKELMGMLQTYKKTFRDTKEISLFLNIGYDKLAKLTEGKDVEANAYALLVGCVSLLIEDGFFVGSRAMTAKRLCMKIFDDVQKTERTNIGFRNANDLIKDFSRIKDERSS